MLGAGAAGLMCAIEAGKRGRRVIVLERAARIGKKILISGGGRCNFTNIHARPENFISANPHFPKSALARYTPDDFVSLVRKYRIRYHEKTLGQLFCDGSAHEIVGMLEEECRRAHVTIQTDVNVKSVSRIDNFEVATTKQIFKTPALVVATGGLSIPKMGATPFGYEIACQFGHKIVGTGPGLVPLTLSNEDRQRYCDLSGISAEVIATTHRQSFREKMLITHRGLSGPAILQASSYWKQGEPIEIDLIPERQIGESLQESKLRRDLSAAKTELRHHLPSRFADRWLDHNPPPDWTNAGLQKLDQQLHHWSITPQGTEGYEKAEVTVGGVSTDELSAKTMESRKVPGLYFVGEVVDVTGHLGGFNFQWAWASGYSAGQAV